VRRQRRAQARCPRPRERVRAAEASAGGCPNGPALPGAAAQAAWDRSEAWAAASSAESAALRTRSESPSRAGPTAWAANPASRPGTGPGHEPPARPRTPAPGGENDVVGLGPCALLSLARNVAPPAAARNPAGAGPALPKTRVRHARRGAPEPLLLARHEPPLFHRALQPGPTAGDQRADLCARLRDSDGPGVRAPRRRPGGRGTIGRVDGRRHRPSPDRRHCPLAGGLLPIRAGGRRDHLDSRSAVGGPHPDAGRPGRTCPPSSKTSTATPRRG